MSWWQLSVPVRADLAEAAAWLIAERTEVPTEVQDEGTLIVGDGPEWARLVLAFEAPPPPAIADAINESLRQLGLLGPEETAAITIRRDDDDGWKTGWRKFFRGQQLSPRVWVRPPWEADDPVAHTTVIIDPGMAFGTGTHETTRGVLRALDAVLGDRPPTPVLDVGCGSGILAIAAARLGHPAIGVEIDDVALVNAAENVAHNGVEDAVRLICGGPDAAPGRAPIVVANIIAPVLCAIAADLAEKAEDWLLLSGLLAPQEAAVRAAYPDFEVHERLVEGPWVVLVTRRR